MQTLKSSSIFSTFHSLQPISIVLLQHLSTSSYTSLSNPPLFNYLVTNLNFNETQALSISTRYSDKKSLEKPQSVVHFFQSLGFTDTQIASSSIRAPQILFADVEKKLKPKVKYFQDLGLLKPNIGEFFSRNIMLLTCSLDKKLIPSIQLLKKVLGNNNNNNQDLFKIFSRSYSFVSKDSILKLSKNIEYLESCGIVGSQLSLLLSRQPRIFQMRETALRELVSRALDMGFSTDSRMLVHAIRTMNCLSKQTFKKKWELVKSFGFSDNDCRSMFRKAPGLFKISEEKMKHGFEFFIDVAMVDKNSLASTPRYLMYSLEDRVIPRYRVLQIIMSKKLNKAWSFLYIVELSEDEFLEFISRFRNDKEELLVAYKPHLLPNSSSEEDTW